FTVVQTKEVENTLNKEVVPFRLRLIASTVREVEALLEEENQTSELLTTLQNIHLHIPPLRNRKEDITLLQSHYVQEFCYKYKKSLIKFIFNTVSTVINNY